MKVAFRISSFCILFFALIFCFLAPAAYKEQLTNFWMCVVIISGVLMIISMAVSIMTMLLLDDKRIEEHKESLKDKYKPIY